MSTEKKTDHIIKSIYYETKKLLIVYFNYSKAAVLNY